MEQGTIAKVINDFLSINDGELSLNKGEIVQIIKMQDMHWCYGCSSEKEGLIPINYLMELEVPILDDNQELFASVANFVAQQPGDLSFEKGEIIIGLRPENDNWWKGKIEERVGVFPTTYVWKLNSEKFKKSSFNLPLNLKARVNTSMKAQLDEEMDLNEGDIITITAVVDKTWYRGVCGDRQGIFPKDFVRVLNEDDLWKQNTPLPNFSSPFDGCATELAGFSAMPPEVPFSEKDPHNSLITFSPEEAKKMSSSAFSSNDFNSITDDLSGLFQSTEKNYFMQESGANEMHGGCTDNLGILPYGITLYPFYGQFDNELSFHEGEIVALLRHIDNDWIEGEIEGKRGILPVSYINIVIDCEYSLSESIKNNTYRSNATNSLRQNSTAMVMHNFHAQMNGDLSVTEGEVIFITELVNEDWCRVRNNAGMIGLCPLNYLSSEELNDIHFPQNALLNDGLPNYADVFMGQEHNVNLIKSQKDTESVLNFHQPLPNNRPKSIDDMIAKNIASLDFNWKTPNKTSGDGEIKPESSCSLDSGIGLLKQNCMTNPPTGVVLENNQNSNISKQEWPKPLSGRLSLPTHLVATNAACGAVPPKDEVSSSERDKRYSELIILDGKHLKKSSQEVPNEDVVFRRQGSDRVPHRPAPPIPVPGQTPVRCTLQRNNLLSNKASSSKPNPERTNSFSEPRQEDHSGESITGGSIERRIKDSEQRQNVISELVITEKEYVRDLKLTYETFHLHNEEFLVSRGIDVKTIFGNIIEIMNLAETLLDKILFSMKNKSDDEQLVAPCFLELADEMKTVYSCYCMNHDMAITLLEKYKSNENIQRIFNKGIETLKYQIACFDMGSILIKPVQRILKYPLILNELIKCTDDTHKDKPLLLEAVKKMTEVASHINEFKRRKDLVSKYLDDGNATLSNRMSKLSLHSVLKKSSRLGMKLSSSLGIGLIAKDPEFDVHELLFRSLEKSIKTFVRNVELFYAGLEEVITCQGICGEMLSNCFKESKYNGVVEFKDTQNTILTKYLVEFKTVIDCRVLKTLNILIDLFEGPDKLIQKRNDKLLDYNRSLTKSEKNRDSRPNHDEILLSKNNYDGLNSQLLEELPKLTVIAYEIFVECIAAFISARKLFTGRATKQYLSLCENSLMLSQGNVLEVFSVKHSLVSNQIRRFSFVTKNFSCEPGDKTDEKMSPILRNKQMGGTEQISQCNSQRVYLQSRYPPEKLFVVKKSYVPADILDLPVNPGNLVAVIKNQDPMGNNKRWFVDAGGSQGFLPSAILEPMYNTTPHSGEDINRPVDSVSVRHSTSPRSLRSESDDNSAHLKTNRDSTAIHDPTYVPPPAYDEIVESNYGDFHFSPQSPSDSADQRYEEPCEESSFSSHVYAEIPDESSVATDKFYYAVYDFGGSGPHTLPITSGQVLKVKNFQDLLGNPEWWLVEDRSGKCGYVPGNYLKKYT